MPVRPPRALLAAALALAAVAPRAGAQVKLRPRAFSKTTATTLYPVRRLGAGVYAVLGDTGKGVEGRPNAGFVVTKEGVLVIGGLASPAQGEAVVRSIRTVTKAPLRWLALYAHHPDMVFGAIAVKRRGAQVIAHPDTRVLANEGGLDAEMADWVGVVGLEELQGFAPADVPDRPVTGLDTLTVGGTRVVFWHPGPAHSAGDLMVWLPGPGVLFAGDVLVEDGVTMVADGDSRVLLRTLDAITALGPRVIVPGHGRIPDDPAALVDSTRRYVAALRTRLGRAVEDGTPMKQALADLPPADERRPVALASRLRRNGARVYVELERDVMGVAGSEEVSNRPALPAPLPAPRPVPPSAVPRLLATDSLAAWLARGQPVRLLDVRLDIWTYLKGHLPEAQYLSVETLRASRGGLPVQPLDPPALRALCVRLGLDPALPVVIYSAGETLNIDATYAAWLLAGFGHPRVFVLDGGYFKWELEHRAVTQRYPRVPPAPAAWWRSRPWSADTAGRAEVENAARGGGALLVDARPPEQFAGEAGAQLRRGHIPGAVNHWWQRDLEQQGFGRVFRPADSLRAAYLAQGIEPGRDIILYCNSATEASHLYFVLKWLLGYPRVRVYLGSWTEWAERSELPVETGPGR